MAMDTPNPTTPPRARARAPDFSAGSSSAPRPKPPRAPRALRALGMLLLALAVLPITAAAMLWWWAGSHTSLATTLARAAQFLPAEQTLESRDTHGSLRSGGRIGWLRWNSPSLAVEVSDLHLGWQLSLPALLQRRLELGTLHAARIQITPLPRPSAALEPPPTPLTELVLPLQLGAAFRVDQLQWAGAPAVEALGLAGDYRFDGRQHRLSISGVELAQGRYSARATLDALAPMALHATVGGTVHTAVPGGGAALQLGAQATLQGTLATADAQLQLQAQVSPADPTPAASPAAEPMQAQVQATLAPWAAQPLPSASATLRAVNLAALWPQAPVTQLHGTLQAGPTPGTTTGWSLQTQLHNQLPGPWDQARLPLTALQASASYDGTRWTVPGATLQAGAGSITAQGHYTPATQALDGQAELRALRPDALHTLLAAAPLSGRLSAQTQGDGVRFRADVRAAAPATTPPTRGPAPLRINAFSAQGSWQAQAGGSVRLDHLLIDALQARVEATDLRLALGTPSAQGRITLTVPGATAQAQGTLAPQTGAGDLQLQWSDTQRTQRWLTSLPLVGADLQRALQGASAQGAAQLSARWKGGWHTLAQQLQAASAGRALPRSQDQFELQATLNAPQLDLTLPAGSDAGRADSAMPAAQALQLRAVKAELSGDLAQAHLAVSGEVRTPAPQATQTALQTRLSGALVAAGQWQLQVSELRLQAQAAQRPGPWALQLPEPWGLTVRTGTSPHPALSIQTSAGQARLTGPLPGTVALRWQPVQWSSATASGAAPRLQTQGTLQGLPIAWVDALGLGETPSAPSLLARMGLATNLVLDGQWNVDTTGDMLRASASLRRASGDLHILAGDTTALHGSGQGSSAGVRQAEVSLDAEGDTVRARLLWASDRAGEIDASVSTRARIARPAGTAPWPADAPLAGTLHARLPDVGVWSALAPPGWRVRGTLDANATLSGTRNAPRWAGTLGADDMAVRSVLDGVDLQGGRLRATLQGNQLHITEFRLQGGRGSSARIAGFSGNRTAAPQDGGTLTATGRVTWADSAAAASTGLSGIAMSLQAEAKALQVLVRADRQVSVSGQLQAQLQQGQIRLRGQLTTDRATIILPDESAPTLGADVVVRSAAKDRADQAKAQASQRAAQAETAKPPDIAITLNLGRDFALQGQGITTRLTGEVDIRSSAVPGAPPRVTGEVRTDQGRYRAWGQMLDVETGLIRFNGQYNNPSLDILALRPNISVRAGVQVSGSALAPRVRLYSDPELPDAEKLAWVVLGRDATAGGAEAAVLQQAALVLLGRRGQSPTGNLASRVGLDEIGFKGAAPGEDANTAALTFGKRISKDLYLTYESTLSGTLGALYIFYDLSRNLTLRGQAGSNSAVDLIYTMKYD